jgi:hypothetical protein
MLSDGGNNSIDKAQGSEKPVIEVKAALPTTTEENSDEYYDFELLGLYKHGERPEFPPVPFFFQG